MPIEDITRNDLEQMFENQAEFFSQRFDRIDDTITELRTTMDRIDRRTDEEIRDVYKRIDALERKVEQLAHAH